MRLPWLLRIGFLLPLLARAEAAPPAGEKPPPAQTVQLNLGLAQREDGPAGSLVRFIPLFTSRHDRLYDARDWLVWPLMTGYSRWTDSSEFFSLPLLTYTRCDNRPGKAPARWWVCAPLLSGGSQWDRGDGPCGAQTFLPVLSEVASSPHRRDVRIVSLWDFTLVRATRDARDREGVLRTWGLMDPLWRGGRAGQGAYGWMAPLFDYADEGPQGGGRAAIMPLFLGWEWDKLGHVKVRPSGSLFERAWPIYLHDPHHGEHHVLWPLVYVQRAPNGDCETLIRPLFGHRQTPDCDERGFGPAFWPLARGFPSDPVVVGHRLVQPLTVRTAPDASSINLLWPLLFHHGEDRRGSETSALLGFVHNSRKPDPFGGEIRKSRLFPLFSRVAATRSRRTLIFPLLWGWEENDSGRYVRPLLIFKVRTGPPSWAKDLDKPKGS